MKSSYISERRSIPITIPRNNSYNFDRQNLYSTKNNSFNPNINSPPNDWMCKLLERVNNYYDCKILCNSAKK